MSRGVVVLAAVCSVAAAVASASLDPSWAQSPRPTTWSDTLCDLFLQAARPSQTARTVSVNATAGSGVRIAGCNATAQWKTHVVLLLAPRAWVVITDGAILELASLTVAGLAANGSAISPELINATVAVEEGSRVTARSFAEGTSLIQTFAVVADTATTPVIDGLTLAVTGGAAVVASADGEANAPLETAALAVRVAQSASTTSAAVLVRRVTLVVDAATVSSSVSPNRFRAVLDSCRTSAAALLIASDVITSATIRVADISVLATQAVAVAGGSRGVALLGGIAANAPNVVQVDAVTVLLSHTEVTLDVTTPQSGGTAESFAVAGIASGSAACAIEVAAFAVEARHVNLVARFSPFGVFGVAMLGGVGMSRAVASVGRITVAAESVNISVSAQAELSGVAIIGGTAAYHTGRVAAFHPRVVAAANALVTFAAGTTNGVAFLGSVVAATNAQAHLDGGVSVSAVNVTLDAQTATGNLVAAALSGIAVYQSLLYFTGGPVAFQLVGADVRIAGRYLASASVVGAVATGAPRFVNLTGGVGNATFTACAVNSTVQPGSFSTAEVLCPPVTGCAVRVAANASSVADPSLCHAQLRPSFSGLDAAASVPPARTITVTVSVSASLPVDGESDAPDGGVYSLTASIPRSPTRTASHVRRLVRTRTTARAKAATVTRAALPIKALSPTVSFPWAAARSLTATAPARSASRTSLRTKAFLRRTQSPTLGGAPVAAEPVDEATKPGDAAKAVRESATVTVLTSTAVGVSAVAVGPTPALDVQTTLAIVKLLDCVGVEDEEGDTASASAARLLSGGSGGSGGGNGAGSAIANARRESGVDAVNPIALEEMPAAAGPLAAIVAVALVNVVAAGAIHAFRSSRAPADAAPKSAWEAFAIARCPSFAHTVHAVLLQGLLVEATLALLAPDALGIGTSIGTTDMAVAGAAVALAAAVAVWRLRGARDPAGAFGAATRPYATLAERARGWPWRVALPRVFWQPAPARETADGVPTSVAFGGSGQKVFGSALAPCRDDWRILAASLPTAKRALTALAIALVARGTVLCTHGLSAVIALHVVSALAVIATVPFRRGFDNALAALVDAATAGAGIALLTRASGTIVARIVIGAGGLGVIGAAGGLAFRFLEPRWRKAERRALAATATASNDDAPLLQPPEGRSGTTATVVEMGRVEAGATPEHRPRANPLVVSPAPRR